MFCSPLIGDLTIMDGAMLLSHPESWSRVPQTSHDQHPESLRSGQLRTIITDDSVNPDLIALLRRQNIYVNAVGVSKHTIGYAITTFAKLSTIATCSTWMPRISRLSEHD